MAIAISIVHPGTLQKAQVDLTEIYQEGDPVKNVVVFGSGQVDRSPCGTGTCAKMACLHRSGELGIGDAYVHSGILDTTFVGRVVEETRVGKMPAVLPEITGHAHITGFHQFVAGEKDPFKNGFRLI
ncbi:MAG: proline racemase family protein [Desulfobacterium sp.]|nr:proline racemase family protein [Desulfobacterium sp.]